MFLLNHVNREQFRNCESKTLLFEEAVLLKYARTVVHSASHCYIEFFPLRAHQLDQLSCYKFLCQKFAASSSCILLVRRYTCFDSSSFLRIHSQHSLFNNMEFLPEVSLFLSV